MTVFKTIRHALALTILAALTCSCTKDGRDIREEERLDTITGIITSTLTRAGGSEDPVTGDISQEWEVGDVIYGYYGSTEKIVKYKVASVDAEGRAVFAWDGPQGAAPTILKAGSSTFHLISDGSKPDFGSIPTDGEFSVDLSLQAGTLEDALRKTVMAASGKVSGKKLELSFSNLTALLKVEADEGFAVKGVSAYHGFSATGTVSINAGSMTFIPGGKGEISITSSTYGSPVYIVIPASSIIGLEVWESNATHERVAMSGVSRTVQPSTCYTFSGSFEPRFHNSLPGLFSISPSDKVSFSKGNLQYKASTGTWRFAPNQYDIIGNGNTAIGPDCASWIDLFGWGTSGQSYTAPLLKSPSALQPYSTSLDNNSYGPEYNSSIELADYNRLNPEWHSDWGCNIPGFFTPSCEEWAYLLFRGASDLYGGYATVCGVKGIILIPDGDFRDPEKNGGSRKFMYDYNITHSYGDNIYDAQGWAHMEVAGAVFLPCSGVRKGSTFDLEDGVGQYWTANGIEGGSAIQMFFGVSDIGAEFFYPRGYGNAVRLVCF